ncbi:MAG: polysaccharide biosynthesis protein [Ruminococcaceae bacterium]|nr:polysaccharide biosynthesis protein [Oscillospiraceae bacterium]
MEECFLKNRILFFRNAALLSLVSILIRGLAVSFNAYVNRKIGAESMGLVSLTMSVYGFAVTVALSCVNLGAVRLTSARCAELEDADAASWRYAMRRVVRAAVCYSLLFGLTSGAALYLASEPIAQTLLGDLRTLASLRVLALSLPFISLSSALSGYFTGIRKVMKNAAATVAEQAVKIAVTSAALVLILPGNVEAACFAVIGGSAVSEAWTLLLHLLLWITDSKRPRGQRPGEKSVRIGTTFRDAASISFPAAVGTYARQGLTTLEHLAIPKGLLKSGLTQERALSVYGLLQGIAFPLVMFPYAVIGSFTSLLVPEMSEMQAGGNREGIRRTVGQVYRASALFSVLACGIFVNFAPELGRMIYSSSEASAYTAALGLLVPFMYLDTAVDAVLKGIGEQVYCMKVNMVDAASGLLLVILLTPALGIEGYILTIWVCEVGNLAASIHRLGKVTGVGLREAVPYYLRPAASALLFSGIRAVFLRTVAPVPSMLIYAAGYALCCVIPLTGKRSTEPA